MAYEDDYDDTGDGYGDEHVVKPDPIVRERISTDCRNGQHRTCVRRRTDDGWCPCPCHDHTVADPEKDPRFVTLLRADIKHVWVETNSEGERRRAIVVEALGHAQTTIELLTRLEREASVSRDAWRSNYNEAVQERRALAVALDQQVDRTIQVIREKEQIAAKLEEFERIWRAPRTNQKRSARRVELDDDEQAATSEGPEQASGGDAPRG